MLAVSLLCKLCVCRAEIHTLADDAEAVNHDKILNAELHKVVTDRRACSTRAVDNYLDLSDVLLNDLEGVKHSRSNADSGAVLVIVEDGDIAKLSESRLDLKASGCGNVLEVNAAEAAREKIYGSYELVNVLCLDAKGECVNVGKRLEECALTLHNRHTCLRADIAETENGRAVGDYRNEIVTSGELKGLGDVLLNLKTGLCNTGGVCKREILRVSERRSRDNLDLSAPFLMLFQSFLFDIHTVLLKIGLFNNFLSSKSVL